MDHTLEKESFQVTERRRWLLFGLPFTFTTYTLTNKKLLLKEGFLNTRENEILLYRIVDMTLSRSLPQRLFGLGTLTVEAQDKSHPTLALRNIRHVREFKELLSNAVEEDKIRLRMRQGELIDSHADPDEFPNETDFDFPQP